MVEIFPCNLEAGELTYLQSTDKQTLIQVNLQPNRVLRIRTQGPQLIVLVVLSCADEDCKFLLGSYESRIMQVNSSCVLLAGTYTFSHQERHSTAPAIIMLHCSNGERFDEGCFEITDYDR
jgi:hypothetical protein